MNFYFHAYDCKRLRCNTLNGQGLLALIAKRPPEQQQTLRDVAFESEYWRPTCASGIKLVERKPAMGLSSFGRRNHLAPHIQMHIA